MVSKCCVPGCRGNYNAKNKVSVFSFPKTEERKQLWLKKIQRKNFTPKATTVVCERHFVDNFIVRFDSAVRNDGSVLIVPRTNPKLTPDAFPSIFPGDSSWKKYEENCHDESCGELLDNEMSQESSVNSIEKVPVKRVEWKGWKEEYLRVSKAINQFQGLACINLDLLELALDLENFPEAKIEMNNVRNLTQEVLNAKEVEFDFASQDLFTKMRYLNEQLTDMFSILTDQEFKSAFAGLMEMELTNICAFPAFLERLVTVKNNPELRNSSMQFHPLASDTNGQQNATDNRMILILGPDNDVISEVDEPNDTSIENDNEIATAVRDAKSAYQPTQHLKNILPFAQLTPVTFDLNQKNILQVAQNPMQNSSAPIIPGPRGNELVYLKPVNTVSQLTVCTSKNKPTLTKQMNKKCTQDKDEGNEDPVDPSAARSHTLDMKFKSFLSQTPPETVGENKLLCPICKRLLRKASIKKHILNFHWKEERCLCTVCGKILSYESSLDNHMQTHISDRKYDCDLCSKSFTSLKSFQRHKSLHRRFPDGDGKIHACSECPKRYLIKSQLHIHQRVHTGERPFVCSKCPGKFISQAKLAIHFESKHNNRIRTNTAKPVFKCSLCNMIMTRHHKMSFHILSHPELLKDCAICNETFESTTDLHSHVKSTHLEDKPFQCTICQESFYSNFQLTLHKAEHNSNRSLEFKCSFCDKSFTMKYQLVKHQKSKHSGWQGECDVCKKRFTQPSSLSKHRQIHGERKYKCNLCEKTFTMNIVYQSHLWTHMKTKKHKCEQCDKGFNDKRHLKSHIKKNHYLSNPTEMVIS